MNKARRLSTWMPLQQSTSSSTQLQTVPVLLEDWRGGNALAAGGAPGGRGAEEEGPAVGWVEAAARATRSKSWREDWAEERVEVECLAFRTRPEVTPAHSEPVVVGTSSGNWLRCWMRVTRQEVQ